MTKTPGLRELLLGRVPDAPAWIEMQAVLLDRGSLIVGDAEGYAIRSDRLRLGGIGGAASKDLIREAFGDIALVPATGADLWAVVTPEGPSAAARAALPDWVSTDAYVYREPDGGLPKVQPPAGVELRFIPREDGAVLELPKQLVGELCLALAHTEVAAAWVDDRPVSFCYAACESRTLWDVSIDTLATHRRRGLAAATVGFLAAARRDRGQRAVWGAHAGNVASQQLATKLGFVPSGHLFLLENGLVEED